jgi:outer membrane receptor protein involved in Fe transport
MKLLLAASPLIAAELPEVTVMAERSDGREGGLLAEWNQQSIIKSSPRTLDELLAGEPSFSLYRRQSAMFGNPTSAGVSLRNTGASAASRTLVLLDGIPQNDPFGGWVQWARYDPATVDAVRVVSSAESVVWGNQSPAGVIQINGSDPFQESHLLRLNGGSQGTYGGSTVHQFTSDNGDLALAFSASHLHSDGFYGIDEAQRGPIDRRLDLDATSASLKLAWKAAPHLTIEPMFSYFEEHRGNGTPLTENSTEAIDASLRVTSKDVALSWQALAYYQHRRFDSFFSSVNAIRTAETPSLDQFDVPASGTGGALTFLWDADEDWRITAGADLRHLEGETDEDATYIAGQFTRSREAGGKQTFAGLFAAAGRDFDSHRTRLDASARADVWWLRDGRRIEDSLITGLNLRDDRQADRDGFEPSLALSLTHDLTDHLQAYLSAGSSFRLPTLNELHRPYRVKNDIVEANASLDPERFISIEGGAEWKRDDKLALKASVFHHWIQDAIANVPVTDPAEITAIFGSIPAGGSGSQRRNVDQARVYGAQVGIDWKPADEIGLHLDGIWTRTEFTDADTQPLLEGKPFPQAPDLRLSARIDWEPIDRVTLFAGYEYGASQFDDALAQRRIGDYTSANLGVYWHDSDHLSYHVRVDNLFDEEIATGLSSDGIRSVAGPRSLWTSVEWRF